MYPQEAKNILVPLLRRNDLLPELLVAVIQALIPIVGEDEQLASELLVTFDELAASDKLSAELLYALFKAGTPIFKANPSLLDSRLENYRRCLLAEDLGLSENAFRYLLDHLRREAVQVFLLSHNLSHRLYSELQNHLDRNGFRIGSAGTSAIFELLKSSEDISNCGPLISKLKPSQELVDLLFWIVESENSGSKLQNSIWTLLSLLDELLADISLEDARKFFDGLYSNFSQRCIDGISSDDEELGSLWAILASRIAFCPRIRKALVDILSGEYSAKAKIRALKSLSSPFFILKDEAVERVLDKCANADDLELSSAALATMPSYGQYAKLYPFLRHTNSELVYVALVALYSALKLLQKNNLDYHMNAETSFVPALVEISVRKNKEGELARKLLETLRIRAPAETALLKFNEALKGGDQHLAASYLSIADTAMLLH